MTFSPIGNTVASFDSVLLKIPISESKKEEIDISGQVRIVEIFQSIYEPFVSGKMTVHDVSSTRLRKLGTGIYGQGEEIDFSIVLFIDKSKITVKDFCIYKVETMILEGTPGQTNPNEISIFYFCSKKMIENEFLKVRKTYNGKISEIVKQIGDEYGFNFGEIEPTDKNYKITIPSLNPADAIMWLTKFAQREKNSNDVNYVFYESLNHFFYFKSIGSMLESLPLTEEDDELGIKITNINVNESTRGLYDQNSLNAKRHIGKTISPLGNAMSGMYSSVGLQFDITSKTYSSTIYSYDEKFSKMTHPQGYDKKIVSDSKGLVLNRIYDHPENTVVYYPKCTYLYKNTGKGFKKTSGPRSDRKITGACVQPKNEESPVNYVHEIAQMRNSQFQSLDQLGLTVEMKGLSLFNLGNMVYFSRSQIDSRDRYSQGKRDKYFTGLFLITNLKQTFFLNSTGKGPDLRTTLTLRKESEKLI
jgi:hypothetical protein